MTLVAFFGWSLACFCASACYLLWKQSRRRNVLLARATHELRGPLCAAQLALSPSRTGDVWTPHLASVELELLRAGRALEDLSAAAQGRVAADVVDRLDISALLRDASEAWRPMARCFDCELELDL